MMHYKLEMLNVKTENQFLTNHKPCTTASTSTISHFCNFSTVQHSSTKIITKHRCHLTTRVCIFYMKLMYR